MAEKSHLNGCLGGRKAVLNGWKKPDENKTEKEENI